MFLFSQGCKGCGDDDKKDTTVKPTFEYDVEKKDEKQAKKDRSDLITPEIDDLIWEDEQEEQQEDDQTQQKDIQEVPQDLASDLQKEVPEPVQESETAQPSIVDEPAVEAPAEKTSAPQKKTLDTPKTEETVVASKAPAEKPKEPVSASPTQEKEYKPVFSEKGKFIVQVASFKKKRNAVNLVGKLKTKGYPVFVDLHETGKGTFYRVRVGNFDTRSGAENFRQKVLFAQGYKSSWVDTLK